MTLLREALDAPWCVISVMGSHAGEGVDVILDRKAADCQTAGQTFWVAKSAKARPGRVQELCASSAGYVVFVEPATLGGRARQRAWTAPLSIRRMRSAGWRCR